VIERRVRPDHTDCRPESIRGFLQVLGPKDITISRKPRSSDREYRHRAVLERIHHIPDTVGDDRSLQRAMGLPGRAASRVRPSSSLASEERPDRGAHTRPDVALRDGLRRRIRTRFVSEVR